MIPIRVSQQLSFITTSCAVHKM